MMKTIRTVVAVGRCVAATLNTVGMSLCTVTLGITTQMAQRINALRPDEDINLDALYHAAVVAEGEKVTAEGLRLVAELNACLQPKVEDATP